MFVQSFLIIGTALILICSVLVAVIYAYLYFRVNKALNSVEKDFTHYKERNEKQAAEVLFNSEQKAQAIIKDTVLFTDQIKKNLYDAISSSIQTGTSTYDELIKEIQNKTAGEILQIQKNLETQMEHAIDGLTNQSIEESRKISENIKKISEEKEREYLRDFDEEKKKGLDELHLKILKLLPEVLSDVVTESLSKEDQERIATDSLHRIKTKYGL